MRKEEKSKSGKFTLLSNETGEKGVYQLKLFSEGSTETLWLTSEELTELLEFLTTREQ